MIPVNILDEDLIPLASVPDELPRKRGGRKVAHVTVYRWTRRGLMGVAPLETARVGNALFTSREAVRRFLDRADRAKGHRHPANATVTTSSKAIARATAELAALGMWPEP